MGNTVFNVELCGNFANRNATLFLHIGKRWCKIGAFGALHTTNARITT